MTNRGTMRRRKRERGQTILLVAVSLVTLLGLAALAIDVVTLYVARSEAQRAADAAALAGAKMIVDAGVTTDPCNSPLASAAQILAMNQATVVAQQNNVSGQPPTATVTFPNGAGTTSCPNQFGINPQVTVTVQRTGLPTFFARIWSRALSSVSATATAEGYNPSNSAGLNSTGAVIPIAPRCTKPMILPNCDPGHGTGVCGPTGTTFIDPASGTITKQGLYPAGVINEPLTLRSGCDPAIPGSCVPNPAAPALPSAGRYFPLALPASALHLCNTTCASGTSGFQPDVECCNASTVTCGLATPYAFDNTVDPESGPIQNGVQCLIHALGQDSIDLTTQSPTLFIAGDSNPFVGTSIQANDHILTSDSVVTIPLYDGTFIPVNNTSLFTIIGYLQIFIDDVDGAGTITAHVLNVSGCGSSPSGTAIQGAATSVPVRLIQAP